MILSFDPGVLNLGYALMDIETMKPIVHGVLNIKHKLHKGVLKQLVCALSNIVNDIDTPSEIVHILIEKQIGRNTKMRQIETAIVMYFETMNKYHIHGMNCEITLYLAYNKFKASIEGFTFIEGLIGKANYRLRKKEVQRCAMYLFNEVYVFDVADCIVQAYCFLLKKKKL